MAEGVLEKILTLVGPGYNLNDGEVILKSPLTLTLKGGPKVSVKKLGTGKFPVQFYDGEKWRPLEELDENRIH